MNFEDVITTHPLTKKSKKIFKSCNNEDQRENAKRYANLAFKKIKRELQSEDLCIPIIFWRIIQE